MASVWVEKRVTGDGRARWRVRWQAGGRETRARSAGTWPTRRLAETAARRVWEALAEGRVPDVAPPEPPRTVLDVAEEWLAGRRDLSEQTVRTYRNAFRRAQEALEGVVPADVTPGMADRVLAGLAAAGHAPATVRKTRDALASVLDHAGVSPNPFRDRRVRLPRQPREDVYVPAPELVEAVLERVAARYVVPLLAVEAVGLRIGEAERATFADLDRDEARWRVPRAGGKTAAAARWIPAPGWLLDAIPPGEGLVWPWLDQAAVRTELRRSGATWGPHALRRRRISLWVAAGQPIPLVCAWSGHTSKALTLDVYSTAVPGREVDHLRLLSLRSPVTA